MFYCCCFFKIYLPCMHKCTNGKSPAQAGEEGRGKWEGSREKPMETATHPFMEDTKECADGDALVNQPGLLQVLGQAHSHQLQQVAVPQFAAKDASGEAEGRRTHKKECFPFFRAP